MTTVQSITSLPHAQPCSHPCPRPLPFTPPKTSTSSPLTHSVSKLDPQLIEALQEEIPELSAAMGRKICFLDVFLLCIELSKLEIESQTQELLSRREARTQQLQLLEQECANLKSQAKALLSSHIGSAVLGILSGMAPIVGHMKGDSILSGLSQIFSSLKGAKQKEMFEGIGKMLYSAAEVNKATGQIQNTFGEGARTRIKTHGDMQRLDQEEMTRTIEQLHERLRQIARFILDMLQMSHDATVRLYN